MRQAQSVKCAFSIYSFPPSIPLESETSAREQGQSKQINVKPPNIIPTFFISFPKHNKKVRQTCLMCTSRLPQGLKVVLLRLADNASVMWRWKAHSCRDESPIHRVAKSLLLFQQLMTMTPMTPMTVGYFCHRYRKYTYYH